MGNQRVRGAGETQSHDNYFWITSIMNSLIILENDGCWDSDMFTKRERDGGGRCLLCCRNTQDVNNSLLNRTCWLQGYVLTRVSTNKQVPQEGKEVRQRLLVQVPKKNSATGSRQWRVNVCTITGQGFYHPTVAKLKFRVLKLSLQDTKGE